MNPARNVMIYDGDCGICQKSVDWCRRRLSDVVDYHPWQRLDLAAYGVTEQQCRTAVQWVGADGKHASGERAIAALLFESGGVWRGVGVAMRMPLVSWLAAVVYRVVASNRHRIPVNGQSCPVPAQPD